MWTRWLAAFGAFFLLAGGIAYATIPSRSGVYTACRSTAKGTIRLIDPSLPKSKALSHCGKGEKQFTFNQQGPAGVPGAAGAAGAPGPKGDKGDTGLPGAPGAGDAYTKSTIGAVAITLATSAKAIKTLSLPAGAYVFIGSARLAASGGGTSNAECDIKPRGDINSDFANINLGASPDRKFVSLNYAVTLTAAKQVDLECALTNVSGGAATADEAFLTAIRVDSVTNQT